MHGSMKKFALLAALTLALGFAVASCADTGTSQQGGDSSDTQQTDRAPEKQERRSKKPASY